jgi:predicted transcriptional regulator
MPDQFRLEELVDRLILLEKIAAGMADLETGRTVTLAEAKMRFAKWL